MAKKKKEGVVNEGGLYLEPLLTRPKKVAIVALGLSSKEFVMEAVGNMSTALRHPFDEVWTLNRGLKAFPHDKLFCMDDFRWLEQRDTGYAQFLKEHDKPVITSTAYPEYPNAVEYPIDDVGTWLGDDIFCVNTVAYMVAYALSIGVTDLWLYGADFAYPDGNKAESGGQAVTYLLGYGAAKYGLKHYIPSTSTLLYANKLEQTPGGPPRRIRYGYHRKAQVKDTK